MRPEFVQHFRHHLVLHAAGTCEANRSAVSADRDLRGAPQTGLFRAALVEAHVIEHMVQRHEFLQAARALAGLHLESIDPAQDAGVEIQMRSHRIEDLRALLHQSGQNFIDVLDRECIVRAIVFDRSFRPGARAIPGLPQGVVLAHEQKIFGVRTPGNQHGNRVGLREAAQIVKMAVLAVGVFNVAVAMTHGCGRQYRDRVLADHAHELAPSACELLTVHGNPI